MPTPLEEHIASDFKARLASSNEIPTGLVEQVHAMLAGDGPTTAPAVLETITSAVGDRTV